MLRKVLPQNVAHLERSNVGQKNHRRLSDNMRPEKQNRSKRLQKSAGAAFLRPVFQTRIPIYGEMKGVNRPKGIAPNDTIRCNARLWRFDCTLQNSSLQLADQPIQLIQTREFDRQRTRAFLVGLDLHHRAKLVGKFFL